jgi:hypothetical protein
LVLVALVRLRDIQWPEEIQEKALVSFRRDLKDIVLILMATVTISVFPAV